MLRKIIEIFLKIFSKIVIQNKNYIIFESFHGKSYSDSPKYIYEGLINLEKNYTYIWVLKDCNIKIPGKPIKIKKNTLKYIYYLYRSKYWIFNGRISEMFPKKSQNVYLQTWHGIPLKKLANDIKENRDTEGYKEQMRRCVERWDYLISPNKYSTQIFKRCFDFKKEILEYGYPRNEILIRNNNIERLKKELTIEKNKKIILYAPTFRDDEYESNNKNIFLLKLDLIEMKKRLEGKYIIFLRLHYFISNNIEISDFKDFVYDVSDYNDINELYLISDILVTDYSSTMFDYALLNRPILFYTYDLENYRDKLRGFYFNFEKEAPGPLVFKTSELIDKIEKIEDIKIEYNIKYKKFQKNYCDIVNKNTTKKIIEKIFVE